MSKPETHETPDLLCQAVRFNSTTTQKPLPYLIIGQSTCITNGITLLGVFTSRLLFSSGNIRHT